MVSLDVGCGKVKRGDIGIDYSKDSDADITADSHHLPFRDEGFGSVSSTVVLEHSPNPLGVFEGTVQSVEAERTNKSRYG